MSHREEQTTEFETHIGNLRSSAKAIGEALASVEDSPWYPLVDELFWEDLDRIEWSGNSHDAAQARYLAKFVLIDDLGPLGRGMLLAKAALFALVEIPSAAIVIVNEMPDDTNGLSYCYKVGMCKIIEASHLRNPPALEQLANDIDIRIRTRAEKIKNAIYDTLIAK